MPRSHPQPTSATGGSCPGDPTPTWVAAAAVAGLVGVTVYVVGWAVAGATRPGYDPMHQAISELFERGAPSPAREILVLSLVLSGIAMVAFGAAMDRGLPGRGRSGPIVTAAAGVLTALVGLVPCTQGCPGFGASPTDTAHLVLAGAGYVALSAAPILTAPRLRRHAPTLAWFSFSCGVVALGGFALRSVGVLDGAGGLQQRIYNTVADVWFVVIAVWLLARRRQLLRDRSSAAG